MENIDRNALGPSPSGRKQSLVNVETGTLFLK